MPTYEATYIIDPNIPEADHASVIEKYQTQVAAGADILSLDNWGRRRLAFEINGRREGIYVTMRFKAEPAVAIELERTLRLADGIVRALIIRMN